MEDKDALIERVARVLDVQGAFCGECYNEPGDFYDECSQCRRLLTGYAIAVVDAVVMPPLAQERERVAEALERRVIDNPTGDVAEALNEAYLRAARIAREETIR